MLKDNISIIDEVSGALCHKEMSHLQNIWNHLSSDLQCHLPEDQNPQSLYIYSLHHVLAIAQPSSGKAMMKYLLKHYNSYTAYV